MIRIHLAQIDYSQAYYQPSLDYLEEPHPPTEPAVALGNMRSIPMVAKFLSASKAEYLSHISSKLTEIAKWSAQRKADILAFPEYSVPPQVLIELRDIAQSNSMLIVAGTHRLSSGGNTMSIYNELGISRDELHIGTACAPVIMPDGTVILAPKVRRSKWEADLILTGQEPKTLKSA
jgi:hypothetical protein